MMRDIIMPWALQEVVLGDDVLEVGPGPGVVTDLLRASVDRLTAVELDDDLADALATRMRGTNVDVVHADATAMPFDDQRFTGADLNRDGKLSKAEVAEKMPMLAKRFAWMDDNRDGFLSRKELQPQRRR